MTPGRHFLCVKGPRVAGVVVVVVALGGRHNGWGVFLVDAWLEQVVRTYLTERPSYCCQRHHEHVGALLQACARSHTRNLLQAPNVRPCFLHA